MNNKDDLTKSIELLSSYAFYGELEGAMKIALNSLKAIDKIDKEVIPLLLSKLDFIGGAEVACILKDILKEVKK